MEEIGFPPFIGYLLAIIVFYLFSDFLFSKTEYAAFYYGFISISFISKLNEKKQNDFLKSIFSYRDYTIVRNIENFIVALPFLVFLFYKHSFLSVLVVLLSSVLLSVIDFNKETNYTIPTPFSKKPFEFIVGFRRTFFIFPFAYFLTYLSISVSNFNLGVASLLLISIVILTYYSKPENEYYVWNFKLSSKDFLKNKIRTGFIYLTFLNIPIVISLVVYFPKEVVVLVGFLLLSYLYLITIILAKYSAYPNEMHIPEGMIIGLSLMFPPILLGIIPFFYNKSIKHLNAFLEND